MTCSSSCSMREKQSATKQRKVAEGEQRTPILFAGRLGVTRAVSMVGRRPQTSSQVQHDAPNRRSVGFHPPPSFSLDPGTVTELSCQAAFTTFAAVHLLSRNHNTPHPESPVFVGQIVYCWTSRLGRAEEGKRDSAVRRSCGGRRRKSGSAIMFWSLP